ncbi:hypothetical protein Tco_0428548 [Tanacetum coccineum]
MNFLHSTFALLLNILSGTPYLEGTLGWEGNDNSRRKPDVFRHGLRCKCHSEGRRYLVDKRFSEGKRYSEDKCYFEGKRYMMGKRYAEDKCYLDVCVSACMGVMNGVWLLAVMLEIGFKGMICYVLPSILLLPSLTFAPFDVVGIRGGGIVSVSITMISEKYKYQMMTVSRELLGEMVLQEDVNQKLLRSLSPEWNTHVVVWRNKTDLDTMSMDDLYNNLKVYKPEVKRMSSSSSSTQNMDFVSSTNNNNSSTNGVVSTAQAVNTANGVSAANT